MATKKNEFTLFTEEVDASTLTEEQKTALKNNFRTILVGVLGSMRTVSKQNGRDPQLSTRYQDAEKQFIKNMSKIATAKFFETNNPEPLVFYTDTNVGPDGDLREALRVKCMPIREFMQKGYYERNDVKTTHSKMYTRKQATGDDVRAFAGTKLPRLDLDAKGKSSVTDLKSKYNVGVAKFFMALTREGDILTAEEYNEYMENVNSFYTSYRPLKVMVDNIMSAAQNGYSFSEDGTIFDVPAFAHEANTELYEKKYQEVMTRLNHAYFEAMQEGRPFVLDVKADPETGKYIIGGDFGYVFGTAFCNANGKHIAKWLSDYQYGTTQDSKGKTSLQYVFCKYSYLPTSQFATFTERDWQDFAIAQELNEQQLQNYRRAIKVSSGMLKTYKAVNPAYTPANPEELDRLVARVAAPAQQEEPEPVVKVVKKVIPAASTETISLRTVKLADPYQEVGIIPTKKAFISHGMSDFENPELYEHVRAVKRNAIIERLPEEHGSKNIKALSVLDSVVDNLSATMGVILQQRGYTPDEITLFMTKANCSMYETLYGRILDDQTYDLSITDGVVSDDLKGIYKGTIGQDLLETALQINGGLTIPQDPTQGQDIVVGSVTVDTAKGVEFRKPATQEVKALLAEDPKQ